MSVQPKPTILDRAAYFAWMHVVSKIEHAHPMLRRLSLWLLPRVGNVAYYDPSPRCPCGLATCVEPWEPGCGLGNSEAHAQAVTDPNVEAVRAKLLERSQVGIRKYGTTTARHDLSLVDWLRHLQEELMDACVYIEAAIQDGSRR